MGIIKNYHDKKWTLQFLDALYNSIDIDIDRLIKCWHFWMYFETQFDALGLCLINKLFDIIVTWGGSFRGGNQAGRVGCRFEWVGLCRISLILWKKSGGVCRFQLRVRSDQVGSGSDQVNLYVVFFLIQIFNWFWFDYRSSDLGLDRVRSSLDWIKLVWFF
jgi:hypothetical protein